VYAIAVQPYRFVISGHEDS